MSKQLRSMQLENSRNILRRPFTVRVTFALGGVTTACELTFKIFENSQVRMGSLANASSSASTRRKKRARLARAFARSSVRETARATAILRAALFDDIPFCGSHT